MPTDLFDLALIDARHPDPELQPDPDPACLLRAALDAIPAISTEVEDRPTTYFIVVNAHLERQTFLGLKYALPDRCMMQVKTVLCPTVEDFAERFLDMGSGILETISLMPWCEHFSEAMDRLLAWTCTSGCVRRQVRLSLRSVAAAAQSLTLSPALADEAPAVLGQAWGPSLGPFGPAGLGQGSAGVV
eukprot:15154430-Alexandrium_andersonii.AAC.1